MGHADLRVGKKIFASLPNDPTRVALKITPANLDALVRKDPATFRDVWGGRWLGVTLATVTAATLQTLLEDAWRLSAPTSLVRAHADADR